MQFSDIWYFLSVKKLDMFIDVTTQVFLTIVHVYTSGVRDYIHVVDLAQGHVAALKCIENGCGCKVNSFVNKFINFVVGHINFIILYDLIAFQMIFIL